MLQKSVLEHTLLAGLSTGADFAEIFIENTKKTNIAMINSVIEQAASSMDFGIGIRLLLGNKAVYAYTNDTGERNLINIAKEAASALKGQKNCTPFDFTVKNPAVINPIEIQPDTVSKEQKAHNLHIATQAAKSYSKSITQIRSSYSDMTQNVCIVNSEGLWTTDTRVRSRIHIEAIASSSSEKQSGVCSPGGSLGFELFNQLNLTALGEEAARTAVTMLEAKPCPSGKMTVVIENGFGGVIFHEACGHSLEATAVARNASVFAGKLGEKIASHLVTAIDDGTIPNAWGSAAVDDEGAPTQKNILIENGILKSYLVDKLGGRKMGMGPTGNSRRESYRFAPTSRMTNTYIAAGRSTPEEIIAGTEYGLYAKKMGGGSVNPATGAFNFAVLEGYMIRNGKIAEPVRGATLIGKGSEVIMRIDMVGNNLLRAQGMCGSISGSIPTDVGQPMIRVSEITVGGRG